MEEKMEADDPNTEMVSDNPNMQQVNQMEGTNVNSSNENEDRAASFHTNSELFEPPLVNPTPDPPSPAWIRPMTETFEQPLPQETIEGLELQAPADKEDDEPQLNLVYELMQEGLELQAPADKGDGEPQLNIVYDPSQHGFAGHETSEPSNQEHMQLGSSGGRDESFLDHANSSAGRDESFLDHANSSQNFKESAFPGFEGSRSSFDDGTDAQQTGFSFVTPAMPNFLTQQENIPEIGIGQLQMLNSGNGVNSAQQNQLCGQYSTGNTFHAEQPPSQQMETINMDSNTVLSNRLGAENVTNSSFNNNEQTTGMGFLNGRSANTNQQPSNTWFSNNQNDLCRPLAQPGSEMYQFKAANSSEPHSNSMLPGSSAAPRPQRFPYQHSQVPLAPRGYYENMLRKLSLSLRPPKQHQAHQQHNAVNLMQSQFDPTHSNPMIKDPLMLSRPEQLLDHQQMMLNLPNSKHHNSELLGTPMFKGVSDHQQLNQASEAPNIMDFSFQNSFLHNPSMPSRLQTMQNQQLPNQTTRLIASYPGPGTSLSNLIRDPFALKETPGFNPGQSFPLQMGQSTNKKVQGSDGLRGLTRRRVDLGESSSPFKRFRGETSGTPQFQQFEATHSKPPSFFLPRPMRNSVYDPMYEGLGLPIDPHLRLFENSNRQFLGASVHVGLAKLTTLDL